MSSQSHETWTFPPISAKPLLLPVGQFIMFLLNMSTLCIEQQQYYESKLNLHFDA